MLLKKLRDSNTFAPRRFEINETTNTVMYFVKFADSEPKASIDLERCNMTFADPSAFNVPAHTMIIQFVQDHSTRHIFVRSEDSRDILNWYNTLRLCKFKRLMLHLSGARDKVLLPDVIDHLTFDLDLMGWSQKSGPNDTYSFKKRWLILAKRRLLYTNNPLSAFAKGEIFIEGHENGFSVTVGAPTTWKKCPTNFSFTLTTPLRPFVFCVSSDSERENWVNALSAVVNTPVTLLDTKQAASILSK